MSRKTVLRHTIQGLDSAGEPVDALLTLVTIDGGQDTGPNLLFTAGIHGDEYEGPATLWRLANTIDPAAVCGKLTLVIAANPLAIAQRRRAAPEDGLDLNRAFPGRADGTITEAIALFLTQLLDNNYGAVFDLHAAGDDSFFIPSTLGHFLEDTTLQNQTLAAMRAFGAPASILLEEEDADTMFDAQVEARGMIFFTAELGSAACLTPQTLAIAWRGVHNLLVHFNALDAAPLAFLPWQSWTSPKHLEASDWDAHPAAPNDGFFVPAKETGCFVRKDELLGHVIQLNDPLGRAHDVLAHQDGWIYACSSGGPVSEKENLVIIGQEAACS